MSDWISVKDELPEKISQRVLVCFDGGYVEIKTQKSSYWCLVIRWMPLPDSQESAIEECNHEWVLADNEIVSGCIICIKCKEIRAASSEKNNQS